MNSLIEDFPNIYQKYWLQLVRPKLGLIRADDSDEYLINLWLKMLEQEKLDFTNSFRHLGLYLSDPEDDHLPVVAVKPRRLGRGYKAAITVFFDSQCIA
jgi:uncharacterized protein YdiU (UPF0061 family)